MFCDTYGFVWRYRPDMEQKHREQLELLEAKRWLFIEQI